MKNTTFPTYDDVDRLLSLEHGDRGFFVLALYAFIEGYLRKRYALSFDDAKFADLVDRARDELQAARYLEAHERGCLNALTHDIRNANKVRHDYEQLSIEELRASISIFMRFAKLSGFLTIGNLPTLERNLDDWTERKTATELYRELDEANAKIAMLQKTNGALASQVAELDRIRTELVHLESEKTRIARELDGLRESNATRDKRFDEMRKDKFAESERVRKEILALQTRIASLSEAQTYLDALSRVTHYTRTRLDYERNLVRLSSEQSRVLDQIKLKGDFLVKGSAGTGKSLVLIKALEKAIADRDASLELQDRETVLLLTYTKSLVAYTRYVSSLLSIADPGDLITTVDKFLLSRFRELVPDGTITFRTEDTLFAFEPPAESGLSAKELQAEAECFIWANMIREDEYVTACIARTGMKKPIREERRKAIWDAVELAAARLRERKIWTRSLSARHVAQTAEAIPESAKIDYLFIDEAQDLPASVLAALKGCARRSVVIAGDADQSVYQAGFSWKRSGIDVSGRSRILRTNFRNTMQLHELAEAYRKMIPGMDSENGSEAFRFGARPEHTVCKNTDDVYESVFQKIELCLKYLSYDPENLCVIAPTNDHLSRVAEGLKNRFAIAAAVVKDESFRFEDKNIVRLSTMHSSKGLDFPVVILILDHRPHGLGPYDEGTIDRMTRNLVYVSITRAMEQLYVCTLENAEAKAITDLRDLMEGQE